MLANGLAHSLISVVSGSLPALAVVALAVLWWLDDVVDTTPFDDPPSTQRA